jgi:hypothetical protein
VFGLNVAATSEALNCPLSTAGGTNVWWCEVIAQLNENFQNF